MTCGLYSKFPISKNLSEMFTPKSHHECCICCAVLYSMCYQCCLHHDVLKIHSMRQCFFFCVCMHLYVCVTQRLAVLRFPPVISSGGGLYFSVLASWALTWWLYSVGHWKTAFDVTHDCVTCGQCQYCIFKMPVDTFPPRPCAYCLQLWPCVWKDGGPENEVVQFKTVRNDFSLCIFHPAGGLVGNFSLESQSKVL